MLKAEVAELCAKRTSVGSGYVCI